MNWRELMQTESPEGNRQNGQKSHSEQHDVALTRTSKPQQALTKLTEPIRPQTCLCTIVSEHEELSSRKRTLGSGGPQAVQGDEACWNLRGGEPGSWGYGRETTNADTKPKWRTFDANRIPKYSLELTDGLNPRQGGRARWPHVRAHRSPVARIITEFDDPILLTSLLKVVRSNQYQHTRSVGIGSFRGLSNRP